MEENEEIELEEEFNSLTIETRDVIKELKEVSTDNNILIKNLDFSILEVHTFFRTNPEEDWEELNDKKKSMFETDEFLAHETLEMFQEYKVEIFRTEKKEENYLLPKITLGSNKTLTSVVATIHKTPKATKDTFLEKNIIDAINKKKIRAGLLVGIREKDMRKEVSKIASKMMIDGCLEEDVRFEVMSFIKPIHCVDDQFIVHYQKKVQQEDEYGRVDYSRRGYVLPVSEGEIILEYIKPQYGKNGRNCRGKFIRVREPIIKYQQNINTTDKIMAKEDDKSIKYIANKQGYVKIDKGTYDIQEEMELNAVDFKSTGSIEAGTENNVRINIKEKDEFKDAIGPGMRVETSILNVEGNVANNAKIKANDVKIGGQTHASSVIEAQKVFVNSHKGTIIGKEVELNRLSGGEVNADTVKVKEVVGGTIRAREMTIDTLMSNATLVTSELIDIKHCKGSSNKLLVDPNQIKGLREGIKELYEKIEKAKKEHKEMPKKLEIKKNVIQSNKQAIATIKDKILALKARKIIPPKNLTNKLLEYQQLVSDYNELVKNYTDKKEEIQMLQEELDEHQSKVFGAKIINHSSWKEYNEIRFRLIHPATEIVYNTKQNDMSREISLKQVGDDEYEIKRSGRIDAQEDEGEEQEEKEEV